MMCTINRPMIVKSGDKPQLVMGINGISNKEMGQVARTAKAGMPISPFIRKFLERNENAKVVEGNVSELTFLGMGGKTDKNFTSSTLSEYAVGTGNMEKAVAEAEAGISNMLSTRALIRKWTTGVFFGAAGLLAAGVVAAQAIIPAIEEKSYVVVMGIDALPHDIAQKIEMAETAARYATSVGFEVALICAFSLYIEKFFGFYRRKAEGTILSAVVKNGNEPAKA
jgi:hypothetical protein